MCKFKSYQNIDICALGSESTYFKNLELFPNTSKALGSVARAICKAIAKMRRKKMRKLKSYKNVDFFIVHTLLRSFGAFGFY